MAKRYTDTTIWDDPWFLDLPPTYKLFWKYLWDRCSIAGCWKVNERLARFQTGDPRLSLATAGKLLNAGRQRLLDHGDIWVLTDFIASQYGSLKKGVRFHRLIEAELSALPDSLPHSLSDSLPHSVPHSLSDRVSDSLSDRVPDSLQPGESGTCPGGEKSGGTEEGEIVRGEEERGERKGEGISQSDSAAAPSLPEAIVDPEHLKLAIYLRDRVLQLRPQAKFTPAQMLSWSRTVRLMIQRDGRSLKDIRALIDWCHDMPPDSKGFTWATNILAMDTLRQRWNEGKIAPDMPYGGSPATAPKSGYVPLSPSRRMPASVYAKPDESDEGELTAEGF